MRVLSQAFSARATVPRLRAAGPLAGLWLCCTACAGEPQSVRELLKAVDGAEPAARTAIVEQFLAAHPENPIVDQNSRLTFFVKSDGQGRTPRIVGDFNGWASTPLGYSTTVGTPTRLAATPWSYLQADAASNARFEYTLLYEKEALVDPRNPRQVRTFSGLHSEIRMPFYVSPPEIDGPIPAATGTLTEEAFASRALQGTRRVWTYLPAGYEGSTDLFPTVYVLDGGNYVADWMGVPGVLDRLIAAGTIRPVIAVFVEPGSRQEEYSRNPAWRAFITSELVPAIDRRHRTFSAPEQRVVLGSSLAAYGAVDLAVAHPDVFAACAALAPPSQTPTLLTNQAEGQRAINGVRFFVLGAIYDSDVNGARALRTVLAEAAGAVTYLEVPHGHAAETFRAHVDEALKALLPAGQ